MQSIFGLALIIIAIALTPSAISIVWEYFYWIVGVSFFLLIVKNFIEDYKEHEGSLWLFLWKGKQVPPENYEEIEDRLSLKEQQERLKDEFKL